jgi:hypothetical protein
VREQITHEALKYWLEYYAVTGIFRWKNRPAIQITVGDVAGCPTPDGYVLIGIGGILYRANRLAWFYMTGIWPENLIDHKDTNRSNNAWLNLREATYVENSRNTGMRSNNTSGVKGVSWHKAARKWSAQINVCGKKTHLGLFSELEDAERTVVAARNELHAAFANHG